MRIAVTLLAVVVLLQSACRSTQQAEQAPPAQMMVFSADQYPAVHKAVVQVLRDYGFRIARNDYRFGAITTYPKESPTFAEYWIDDATTPAQRRSDTLNSQQRTVEVSITQPSADLGYELRIAVKVERLQQPERYLTHSATPRLTASYDSAPEHLAVQGIDGPYAQPLTSDPALQARLLESIRAAVSE